MENYAKTLRFQGNEGLAKMFIIESDELIQKWELGVKEHLKRAEVQKYFERVTTLHELFLSLKRIDPEEFSEGFATRF